MKVKDTFITKDLGEAAALLCASKKLLRLQKETNFYWFVFYDKSSCEKISNEYWFGNLLFNAKTYNNTLKSLKNRLFRSNVEESSIL